MDNLPDASSALLSYIDALLVEGDAAVEPIREIGERSVDKAAEVISDADMMRLLFFKVAGVPLAIEADDIGEVIEGKEAIIQPSSGKEGGVIGIFNHHGHDIHVIDTGAIILPQGHPARHDPQEVTCKPILMLAGYELALLCDEKGGIATLNRREVLWRVQRQTRPWLAGMVKGHKHALLDIEGLIKYCGLENFATY